MTRTALLYWASTALLSLIYPAAAGFHLVILQMVQQASPSSAFPPGWCHS